MKKNQNQYYLNKEGFHWEKTKKTTHKSRVVGRREKHLQEPGKEDMRDYRKVCRKPLP